MKLMKPDLKILVMAVLVIIQPGLISGQFSVSGKIIDETTKGPVQFANIWIKGANIGTTADDSGRFSINADSIGLDKNVIISAIGYYDTVIPIDKVQPVTVLRQKVYQLSEIAVFPGKKNTLVINDLSDTKIGGGILNDTTPRIVGRFFPYEERNRTFRYVKSVTVYSRDTHKGKFNLRLYSFDTLTLRPIKELVSQNIIVSTRSSLSGEPKPVEIDLSEYNIVFPDGGLLVCVEWLILPENRYKVSMSYTDSNIKKEKVMYAPNLAATMERKGYMYEYTKGVWWKPPRAHRTNGSSLDDCYFNPAVSLELTD